MDILEVVELLELVALLQADGGIELGVLLELVELLEIADLLDKVLAPIIVTRTGVTLETSLLFCDLVSLLRISKRGRKCSKGEAIDGRPGVRLKRLDHKIYT